MVCTWELAVSVPLTTICLIAGYVVGLFLIRNLCSNSMADLNRSNRVLTVLSIFVFCCYFISLHGFSLLTLFECINASWNYYSVLIVLIIFYIIGQLLILFVFLLRIEHMFVGSLVTFSYSKQIMKRVYFSIICCIIVFLVAVLCRALQLNDAVVIIAALLFIVSYVTNYACLVTMFWNKISAILAYKTQSNASTQDSDSPDAAVDDAVDDGGAGAATTDKNKSNSSNRILTDLTNVKNGVRYTTSVYVAFVSTIVVYVFFIIYGFISLTNGVGQNSVDLTFAAFSIDALINAICIYLLFSFGDNAYTTVCGMCRNCTHKQLMKKIVKSSQNMDATKLKDFQRLVLGQSSDNADSHVDTNK